MSDKLLNKDVDLKMCKMLKLLSLKQGKGCLIYINNTNTIIKIPELIS